MQIREFSKPVTSKKLNESLAKKFGYKLNLEQFTEAQLEDVRNKLRTEMSQFELSENFDSLPSNGKYQKTRALLDVINQAILERADSKCDDCGHSPCDCTDDEEEAPKSKKTDEGYVASTIRSRANELAVPESWINSAINRIELGESDREELKAELLTRYDLNESAASWLLLEGEEEKAETILATKDMVDRVTGWLEDVAAMKAEQLLELMDSIRETQGSETAQQWSDTVKPALEAVYTALETSRQGIQQGLGILSGEQVDTMGAGPAPMAGASAPEAAPELGAPEEELDLGMDASAEEAGRMKRESVEYSRRLGILLNSKKK